MSLLTTIHDSLPYIDVEPTPSQRAAAQSLIDAELLSTSKTEPHPSLPPQPTHHFSPLIEAELRRIENKEPLNAIDRTRYESLSPPSPSPSPNPTATLEAWRQTLSQSYTSATYLSTRSTNLALLHEFGKNSWLIGNSQLEDILKGLERELELVKGEIDGVVIERRDAQEGIAGEVRGLQEGWKRGVGRVLETEVAAEGVRREILERRREGAR
jgi:pre-mRNA-splicing factor SPF27